MTTLFLKSKAPVARQVSRHVRSMIAKQGLQPGDPLPSYRELAEELQVAYMTVKRAFDLLSEEGIVHRVPAKGCFVRKMLATERRVLANVGLLCSGSPQMLFEADYLSEIVRGVIIESQPDADVHIFSLEQDGLVSAGQIAESGVDAVILLGVENDEYLEAFTEWGTPGVVVDYCSDRVALDFVACDNRAGARHAAKHLAALGHRRVAYVDMAPARVAEIGKARRQQIIMRSSDMAERRVEALKALDAFHVAHSDLMIGDVYTAAVADLVEAWRNDPDPPTAFLAYDENVALWLVESLDRAGIRVPEDVSVCAAAGSSEALFHGRPLSYCRYDFMGMGREAVKILRQRCLKPGVTKPIVHRIGFEFVDGYSTAPPSAEASGS
ncbi:MAG: GntR family transcriptional regulator [Lentisphaerae bacterium]|nr:GntR family transcriptional regulator [Lentisphaerota bacterium]